MPELLRSSIVCHKSRTTYFVTSEFLLPKVSHIATKRMKPVSLWLLTNQSKQTMNITKEIIISGTSSKRRLFTLSIGLNAALLWSASLYVPFLLQILAGLGMNLLAVPLVVLAAGTLGDAIFEFKTFHEAFRNRSMSTI